MCASVCVGVCVCVFVRGVGEFTKYYVHTYQVYARGSGVGKLICCKPPLPPLWRPALVSMRQMKYLNIFWGAQTFWQHADKVPQKVANCGYCGQTINNFMPSAKRTRWLATHTQKRNSNGYKVFCWNISSICMCVCVCKVTRLGRLRRIIAAGAKFFFTFEAEVISSKIHIN